MSLPVSLPLVVSVCFKDSYINSTTIVEKHERRNASTVSMVRILSLAFLVTQLCSSYSSHQFLLFIPVYLKKYCSSDQAVTKDE